MGLRSSLSFPAYKRSNQPQESVCSNLRMGSLCAIDEPMQYPHISRDESVVDNYHGVLISDPYRWLEDPDAEKVKDFVEKQVKLTESVLQKCDTREKLREKITELFDHPRYNAPFRRGDKYFYFHNTGLQAQDVLYMQVFTIDSLDGEPQVLLDPNGLSEDGTVSLNIYDVSKNAKYLGYGLSSSGSDWYLLLYTAETCEPVNKVYYCDMSALANGLEGYRGRKDLLPFVKLIDNFDAEYGTIANDNTIFTFRTNKDAPKYKLVRVDLKEPSAWTDVVQEAEKDVLESAVAVNGNQILLSYLSDVKYVLQLRDLKTGSILHHLPIDIGSVSEISARREDSTIFIGFTSFLTPGIIYQCKLDTGVPNMKIFREIVVPGFDRTAFDVNQVFVPSKDGIQIPMFIVARKNILLDGSHPCLLYGYGGFNSTNIRGGGEYGEEWHKAGSLAKKQNCFDDFISAAEFLVSSGYTQSKKLCIEGGSNGGLLVGACINQRPDLFGCALAHVGVMDMLRFHKFTIGHAWTSDYGCSEKEEEFHWQIK
ncbi:hypothetical protein HYC85_008926 [Camellia sinensis]|uniref:Prolyl endopeptidase n=1 Tax=Camellia sinensis TaxID=4442 RepID=A0A7J7HT95_CAMSI|nr:hypothetical protein HYC85_008926 [Camellia sinensis]